MIEWRAMSVEPAAKALTADGVFSGGGIKGLAFAGALAGAEEAGYGEWHQLAGHISGRDHGDGARPSVRRGPR